MVKIGLLSDTHGHLPAKLFDFFSPCHEIWHAGDIGSEAVLDRLLKFKPVQAVYGNIDDQKIRLRCNEIIVKKREGLKMAMMHIGGYPGRYQPKALKLIKKEQPGIFISGHSHILKVIFDKQHNLLHINPGAAGNSGLHQKITMVRFDIENGAAKNLEIFETDSK